MTTYPQVSRVIRTVEHSHDANDEKTLIQTLKALDTASDGSDSDMSHVYFME